MANTQAHESGTTLLMELTGAVIAAYVGHNPVPMADVPKLIKDVHSQLSALAGTRTPERTTDRQPAVPVKKSVLPDYVVCLEDGKKLKMLKRYLRTNYNMTPEEYRARWGLPADYPMVAPNYATARSTLAKKIGLGRTGRRARLASKPHAKRKWS